MKRIVEVGWRPVDEYEIDEMDEPVRVGVRQMLVFSYDDGSWGALQEIPDQLPLPDKAHLS